MKYNKEYFSKIVSESKTLSDVARNLDLSPSKGNRDTIKKYINFYDLDVSHFKYNHVNRIDNFNKKDILLILVENSTYSTTHLKNRLYNEGIKERRCELCGQDEYWNKNKMSLILDHINGINNDHRIENLRIVCPNCNATLNTNCSKNKTKYRIYLEVEKNKCIDCSKIINKKCKRCIDCDHINQRKVERPTIEQILKDVNEFGYVGTGKKYGVSDNTIRKWIKNKINADIV